MAKKVSLNPEYLAVKALAEAFTVNSRADRDHFNALWECVQVARKIHSQDKNAIASQLETNYTRLGRMLTRQNGLANVPGFSRVYSGGDWVNTAIFSDHHIAPRENRHDYFSDGSSGFGHKKLYIEMLKWYRDNDYRLVENGDVEEYVIFEPTGARVSDWAGTVKKKGPIKADVGDIDFEELQRVRDRWRPRFLESILNDHSEYYDFLRDNFLNRTDRWVKVAGNHDPYLRPVMRRKLNDYFGQTVPVYDFVRLTYRDSRGRSVNRPKYLITHGHQFDAATMPSRAFEQGELFSECLAWTIQGADRIWEREVTQQWRTRVNPASFNNDLATAKSNFPKFNVFEAIAEIALQNHEIAWEYFESDTPVEAFFNEVSQGEAYFKVRHLSETKLMRRYNDAIDRANLPRDPTLIIGHTHEVRHRPRNPETGRLESRYMNTGSAGRFQNLVWGIEIVGGVPTVISWSNQRPNSPNVSLRKIKWTPNSRGRLIPEDVDLGLSTRVVIPDFDSIRPAVRRPSTKKRASAKKKATSKKSSVRRPAKKSATRRPAAKKSAAKRSSSAKKKGAKKTTPKKKISLKRIFRKKK